MSIVKGERAQKASTRVGSLVVTLFIMNMEGGTRQFLNM